MILDYVSRTGALPFEQQIAQNFTSELQWSPNFMVGIILEGALSIHYGNHTRQFALHDIFFFPPFDTFSFVRSEARTRALLLMVHADYISSLCPDVRRLFLHQNHVSAEIGRAHV